MPPLEFRVFVLPSPPTSTPLYIDSTQNFDPIFNPLNAELNTICHFLALLGAHHILHVSRVRVNMQIDVMRPVFNLEPEYRVNILTR